MILRHVHTLHLHAHAISLKRWKQIFGSSNCIPYTLSSILGLQGLHIAFYFGVLWTTVSTTGKDNHRWLSDFMFYDVIKTHCANDVIRKLTTIVNYSLYQPNNYMYYTPTTCVHCFEIFTCKCWRSSSWMFCDKLYTWKKRRENI